jgi:hypothetical protein
MLIVVNLQLKQLAKEMQLQVLNVNGKMMENVMPLN